MAKSYRTLLITFLFPLLLLYWGACGGGAGGPTVTASSTTGTVYTTASIAVTFSDAMDQASVESAFSITGSDPVAGTFSWADNTVTFTPDALWKTHHPYTLTITTAAKSSTSAPLAEDYTQTFTPQINLHDVNGDGINDFLLGAPFYDNSATSTDNGQAYLFYGKTTWSNVDLASATADVTYSVDNNIHGFGWSALIVGDMNGDGYAELAFGFPGGAGAVLIVNGSTDLQDFEVNQTTATQAYAAFIGTHPTAFLGFPIIPVGDVNGDGLADIVVGSAIDNSPNPNDSRFWLILGQTDAFPTITFVGNQPTGPLASAVAAANYAVKGHLGAFVAANNGLPAAACDINDDELDDMIFGSPAAAGGGTKRGAVYVVAGSATPSSIDLRSASGSAQLFGESEDSAFGGAVACGDVNGDGLNDILVGAPNYNFPMGKAYLATGTGSFTNYNFSSEQPTASYTGATNMILGTASCVQGDVNNDGIDDMFVGAPFAFVNGTQYTGEAFVMLGSESPPSIDFGAGGSADARYSGQVPATGGTLLGYCKSVGDINEDGIDDILIGAPAADGGGDDRGQVYLILGRDGEAPPSIDFNVDNTADATFTGAGNDDLLMLSPSIF